MPMLTPGRHDVRVTNCRFKPPKDGKPPELAISFEDDAGDYLSWFTSLGYTKDGFSLKAYEYAANQLRGLGWDDVARNFRFEELADPALSPIYGVQAVILVVNEPYNGQDQIKVKYIDDPNRQRTGGERMDADTAHKFADVLRNKLRESGKPVSAVAPAATNSFARSAAPAAPAKPLNPPTNQFDDIPF